MYYDRIIRNSKWYTVSYLEITCYLRLSSLFIVPVSLLGGAAKQDCGTVPHFVELRPAFSTCSTFWGPVPHF